MANRLIAVILLLLLQLWEPHSSVQLKNPNIPSASTYTSTRLRLSYTYPIQLVPNTAYFRKRLPPPKQQEYAQNVVAFSAFETPLPGKAREGIVIMYDDVALYGPDWDAEHCVRRTTMMQSKQGWSVLRRNVPAVFDGQKFVRADYERHNPSVFQSVACTIWNGEALQFILSGATQEEIDDLFRSLATLHFQRSK
jgi:hypothetical protein